MGRTELIGPGLPGLCRFCRPVYPLSLLAVYFKPFMKAILSDIHANLEALNAVLDDMGEFDVEAIYCLGDTVGYGPDPCECLDVMMHFQVALLGNHEEAARGQPEGFTAEAATAARWTQRTLQRQQEKGDDPAARQRFLKGLPLTHEEGDFLFVHGSPRDPTREYIFPLDVEDPGKMWDIFRQLKRYCFVGHTHFPGIFTETYKFHAPAEIDARWRLDAAKLVCNVGSVGQPRDGDLRACYVLLDKQNIYFRRVPYPVDVTVDKMKRIPELKGILKFYEL
jgi:diadenosine tetraphosphatase ApaH/serine/threonine PP2A family protein phosphatase